MKISLTGVLEDGSPRQAGVPTDTRAQIRVPKGEDTTIEVTVIRPSGEPVSLTGLTTELLLTVKRRPDTGVRIGKLATRAGNVGTFALSYSDTRGLVDGLYSYDVWLTLDSRRYPVIPLSPLVLLASNAPIPYTPAAAPPLPTSTPTATAEPFTVELDATNGTDPTDPIVIFDQASSTAWGAFQTIPGAVNSLPETLRDLVTLLLPDGIWSLGSDGLGELHRHFPAKRPAIDNNVRVGIQITSRNGWAQAAGTPASMAVQSSSGGTVTLQADPGLTADAYSTYFLLVSTGTGAGQYKPIRSHTGAVFEVAGTYDLVLDSTSTVQIVSGAATLAIPALGGGNNENLRLTGPVVTLEPYLDLNRINVVGDSWAWLKPSNIALLLSGGTRIVDGGIWGGNSDLWLEDCVIDASGTGWFGYSAILLHGGRITTTFGTDKPFLLKGRSTAGQSAILLLGPRGSQGFGNSQVSCFVFGRMAFDGWAYAYLEAQTKGAHIGPLAVTEIPVASPQAQYVVVLQDGAVCEADTLADLAASSFKGSVSDVLVDGTGYTWSAIDSDPNDVVTGVRLSMVVGD